MSKVLKCAHCQYSTTRTYNLKRHQLAKHPDATINSQPAEPESQNVMDISQNVMNPVQNVMDISQNVMNPAQNVMVSSNDNCLLNQCNKCEKYFASLFSLRRHTPICKGKLQPNQCNNCLKILSNRQNKYHHIKTCKADNSASQPTTINNITKIWN